MAPWQGTLTHCCVITDVTFTTDLQRKDIVMFYRIVQDLHPCLDGAQKKASVSNVHAIAFSPEI